MTLAPPTSVRVNTLMPQNPELRRFLAARGSVAEFCGDSFQLAGEQRVGACLEHLLGALYIQARAATLAVEALAPEPGERILDMAAAPGGKSTQIAARMRNTGLLVANEPNRRRLAALVGNLERCGVHNAVVTRESGTLLARYFHNYFDRVLLDAPCSGDGILCKNQALLRYWSVADAVEKGRQQTGLIRAAVHMLRPGGILVYSTCSLSTEENEDVLLSLMRTYPGQVEVLELGTGDMGSPLPAAKSQEYPARFARAARVWPHHHNTEGAFVARLRKLSPTEWRRRAADVGEDEPPAADPEAFRRADQMRAHVNRQWGFDLPATGETELVAEGKHLSLRPREHSSLCAYPFFVRSGMRVASIHKSHPYLTHWATVAWGHRLNRLLNLDWEQVKTLFGGQAVDMGSPRGRGEVVLASGPWTLTRGRVLPDGCRVEGFVPKALHTRDLSRLIAWGEDGEFAKMD